MATPDTEVLSLSELRSAIRESTDEVLSEQGYITERKARRLLKEEMEDEEEDENELDDEELEKPGYSREELQDALPDDVFESVMQHLDEDDDELGEIERMTGAWQTLGQMLEKEEVEEEEIRKSIDADNPSTEIMELTGLVPEDS